MENHVKTSDVNYKLIRSTINKIETFVKENDYQIKDSTGLDSITEKSFNAGYSDMSSKKRKKLAHYIWLINNKVGLGTINKFFHFLMKNVMKSDLRVRIIKSQKELDIEAKRKVYKEALAKMQAAYADYKQEKGTFYKDRATVQDYLKRNTVA